MRSRTLLLVLFAAVAAALLAWFTGRPAVQPPLPAAGANSEPAVRSSEPLADADARSSSNPVAEVSEPDTGAVVHGRVVDVLGAPLEGLAVAVRDDERDPRPSSQSERDGGFALQVETLPCEFELAEPGWTTVRYGTSELAPLVAARTRALEGLVVEPSGDPLAGAAILVRGAPGSVDSFTCSGGDGRFRFEALAAIPDQRIRTTLEGWVADERELALDSSEPLRIVLQPAGTPGPLLEGSVVRPDGTPAPGAEVVLGAARARANAEGRFRLHVGFTTRETPLVARLRGYQPALVAGYGARIDPLAPTLPPERLQLPGTELTLEGRVEDATGAPLKGWRVRLADPTPLDPGGFERDCVESGPDEVRTDTQGKFKIAGLAARSYTLLASGRDRASRCDLILRSEPTPAGTRDVRLRVERADANRTLRGRVVDETGAPLAEVLVGLGRATQERGSAEFLMQGRLRARTDAQGRFEIAGAPPGVLYLVATHPGNLPRRLALNEHAAAAEIVLALETLRPFRLECAAGDAGPDRLRALGAEGSAELWSLEGAQPVRLGAAALGAGRPARFSAGPDARELVLYRGSSELARFPAPARAHDGQSETLLRWP